jgi:hypothetical protein
MICTYIRCDTPTADGQTLCHADTNRLRDILGWIPDALDTLADTVARMDRTGSDGGSSSGDHAEAVNVDALDAKIDLEERVGSWARMVLEADTSDDLRNVPPLTYLRLSIDLIRTQDYAGDMLDELSEALRKVTRAADIPADRIDLGNCWEPDCHGRIRGEMVTEDGKRVVSQRARCNTCRTPHDGRYVHTTRLTGTWGHWCSLADAVKLILTIPGAPSRRTIYRWADHGKFATDGEKYSPAQMANALGISHKEAA